MIYLDNNATTQLDDDVLAEMQAVYRLGPLNASSQHRVGRLARKTFDEAVSRIGIALGADVDSPGGDQLIITSGGTEANHLALTGLGEPDSGLVVSSIEHPSVLSAAGYAKQQGRSVRLLAVESSGRVDAAKAFDLLDQQPAGTVVSVMAANNETGVLQPWNEIAEHCYARDLICHVDATQWVGKLPVAFGRTSVSAVTFAAHKFHGPAGVGGLLIRRGVKLRPAMHGGEQQLALRPGTEPVPLVVGMAKAIELAQQHQANWSDVQTMRDRLEQFLRERIPETMIFGSTVPRLPGTSCFALPNTDRQAMLLALDMSGVACSSGSACASGSSRPSHVLQAMNAPESQINAALRVGLSRFSTMDEVERAGELIVKHHQRLRTSIAVEK